MTAAPRLITAISPAWSAECYAFVEFWKSLRGDALMPTTEDFLDRMSPRFVRASYLVDVLADRTVIRFQGTELNERWGLDATGQDLSMGRSKTMQARMVALLEVLAAQPCAYVCRSAYVTSRARPIETAIVCLPLAVKPGRAPRTVSFTTEVVALDDGEVAWNRFDMLEHGWLDIGAGVPDEPPVLLGM
jgi:hypothetical protein